MNRWLVTGAAGMLGRDLTQAIASTGVIKLTALDRSGLDITDPERVNAAVAGHDLVINTAAWTDVDGAETNEAQATEINGRAVGGLARACRDAGAKLIHLSTDYVFAGTGNEPYSEQAGTDPVNAYGRSKLAGEVAVLAHDGYVIRTSWLYGAHGRNFVSTVLRLAGTRETLDVVDDQIGQPTWTKCLADQLVSLGTATLLGRADPGVYHGTASGQTTWFGLAQAAFTLAGLDPARVRPVRSDAFPRPAARPAYSVLGHDRWHELNLQPQPHWHDQLAKAYADGTFASALTSA